MRLKERIATLKDEMSRLEGLKARMEATPDGQVSLTDPDARSMASQGKGTGIVGYNVQTVVDTKHPPDRDARGPRSASTLVG